MRFEAKVAMENSLVGGISGFQYTSLRSDRALGVSGWCWGGKGSLLFNSDFVAGVYFIADFTFQKDLGFANLNVGQTFTLTKAEYRYPLLREKPVFKEVDLGAVKGVTTCEPLDEAADMLEEEKVWKLGELDWNNAPNLAWTKTHELKMQPDGNLVLYKFKRDSGGKITERNALWASNTGDRPGSRAEFQKDGNLVVYDIRERAMWASGSSGQGATEMKLQSDGNLVIYAGDRAVWASGTGGK
jgi:hypothetical protein